MHFWSWPNQGRSVDGMNTPETGQRALLKPSQTIVVHSDNSYIGWQPDSLVTDINFWYHNQPIYFNQIIKLYQGVLRRVYWQIFVENLDYARTPFVIANRHFQFKMNSLELCNAPATFHRINLLLGGYQWWTSFSTFQSHLNLLSVVLEALRTASLQLNSFICCLSQREINVLGHFVSGKGLLPSLDKILAIKDFFMRCFAKYEQWFASLSSYFLRSATNFARLTHDTFTEGHIFLEPYKG